VNPEASSKALASRSNGIRRLTLIPVLAPGLFLALIIAAASRYLSATMPMPAVFFALAIGVAVRSILRDGYAREGIDFGARVVLRFGVALLGIQISLTQFSQIGLGAFLMTIGGLLVTLTIGVLIGRLLGLSRTCAFISAAAVAICGASAALAVAAALPESERKEDATASVVATVTVLGTIGMLLYPAIARQMGLDAVATGVFLGGTLHEVVQAVGAGYAVSEKVGETATIIKLVRVACLVPVVLAAGMLFRRSPGGPLRARIYLPAFLLAFIALAALNSLGLVAPEATLLGSEVSRWCLLVAIASLGMKTSFATMRASGLKQVSALTLTTIFLAGSVLAALALLTGH
jgi:uncharacterized integral membrane protein (TIGR00698 family)